jgi:hypothetical protein
LSQLRKARSIGQKQAKPANDPTDWEDCFVNVNLNAGGIIGGIAAAIIGIGVAVTMADEKTQRLLIKIAIGGTIVGALAGNVLWTTVFGKRKAASEED